MSLSPSRSISAIALRFLLGLTCTFNVQAGIDDPEAYCSAVSGADIIGVAVSSSTKTSSIQTPIYCEYHFHIIENNALVSTRVEYWDIYQKKIAEKKLNFSLDKSKPNVVQEDFRHGEIRSVLMTEDGGAWQLEYRKAKQSAIKKATVSRKSENNGIPFVIDAGFDNLIRENWVNLSNNKSVTIKFVSPVHGRSITLLVERGRQSQCTHHFNVPINAPAPLVCYVIRPKNKFLRLLAKPIFLSYESNAKTLAVFSGVVNITTAQGQSQNVHIYYQYF